MGHSWRRRNRANGTVRSLGDSGFALQVQQSFGNCPQYIQSREFERGALQDVPAEHGTALAGRAAELVRRADTFFIATQALTGEVSGGADVSHRGGKPGFVRVDAGGMRLSWPDFAGNGFFNTLGNLALDARAGLVFVDFDMPDMNGLEVVSEAKLIDAEAGRHVMYVCLTGGGPEITDESAGAAGFNRLLYKPLKVTDLLAVLLTARPGNFVAGSSAPAIRPARPAYGNRTPRH